MIYSSVHSMGEVSVLQNCDLLRPVLPCRPESLQAWQHVLGNGRVGLVIEQGWQGARLKEV